MTNSKDHINTDENSNVQFMIQRIYIKDLSYEAPNTPAVFQQKWEPDLAIDLNTTHTKLEKDVYEVVLSLTATIKNQNTLAFLIEVKQAGIFSINGPTEQQLDHLLHSFCPNILFPYARTIITNQATNGSFPQLILAPINFDALYTQQMAEKQKDDTAH